MPSDGAARQIMVSKPADLAQVLKVLGGQEFHRAEIEHDARRRTLTFSFSVKFGATRGRWALEVLNVDGWHALRGVQPDRDVLKDLTYDKKAGRLTILSLLEETIATVSGLDVRVHPPEAPGGAASEAPGAPKQGYDDLPEALRRDAEQRLHAQARVYERAAHERQRMAKRAALSTTLLSAFFVLIAGGHWLVLVLGCPLISGGLAYLCIRHSVSRLAGMLIIGAGGFLLLGLAVNLDAGGFALVGPLVHVFFGGLTHIGFGGLLVVWMREEHSVRI